VSTQPLQSERQDGAATGPFEGYAPPPERPPLGSYAMMSGAFIAACAGFYLTARRNKLQLPEQVGAKDIVLIGAATHKLSRLIAKDKVTSFLRAPFKRYEEEAGPGELSEQTRGEGFQAAVGELLGCPYCLGLWVSAGLTGGLVVAPRETRLAASTLSALTVADFLQLGYGIGLDKL
jgi:Protein of unknown function (DUF1360)